MGTTLHTLKPNAGATRNKKRLGRGHGSGLRKTAGKGAKGQKARTGHHGIPKPAFEGGQTPMPRRFPKRGFKNRASARRCSPVNLGDARRALRRRATVDVDALKAQGPRPALGRRSSRSSATASSPRSSRSRRTASRRRPRRRSRRPAATRRASSSSAAAAAASSRTRPQSKESTDGLGLSPTSARFRSCGGGSSSRSRCSPSIASASSSRRPGVNRAVMKQVVQPGVGHVPRPVQHVLGRRARAAVDLRARHHAVHQRRRSSCSCSPSSSPSSSSSRKKGEQGQTQDQPVHALRHDRAVAGPVLLHRALASRACNRTYGAVRQRRRRSRAGASGS